MGKGWGVSAQAKKARLHYCLTRWLIKHVYSFCRDKGRRVSQQGSMGHQAHALALVPGQQCHL